MVEHPLKQDLLGSQNIVERIQVQVKDITQQYAEFRQNINEYTLSNKHGSRASHNIVLGSFLHGFWDKPAAQHLGCCVRTKDTVQVKNSMESGN